MATLQQIYNARRHADLRARTEAAVLVASQAVQVEDPGTANHAERLAMANRCLTDQAYLTSCHEMLMFSVGTNADISADPDGAEDNDIQWVVDTQYTNVALSNPPA